MDGNIQNQEIVTIKSRKITLNLSDADCERLAKKAGSVGFTVGQLLESFIGDLCDGTFTNGSDERMHANQWFERCGFSWMADNTFLKYLIDCDIINEFNDIYGYLKECEDDLKILDDEEKIKDINEELAYQKEQLQWMYDIYAKGYENAEPFDVAVANVIKWYEDFKMISE